MPSSLSDSPALLQQARVITGAGQRAGFALATHWLAEGYPVIFSYRHKKAGVTELEQRGGIGIQADFTQDEGILAFAAQVVQHAASLSLLVHNASEWSVDVADLQASAALHRRLFQVHQQAPYLLNLALHPLLLAGAQDGAPSHIIHLSDDAVRRGSAKHAAYLASKAGLENLTYSFAARFAPQVRVNAIAPALLAFHPHDSAAYRQKAQAKSPLNLVPGFDCLVQTVDYLLTQPYITGSVMALNGGRHLRA